MDKLQNQSHRLAQELYSAIQEKVSKRRKDAFQSLVLYLNNSTNLLSENHFKHASVYSMNKLAVTLMERLFGTTESNDEEDQEVTAQEESSSSLAQQLAEAVSTMKNSTNKESKSTEMDYKKEMGLYGKTKQRTANLDRLLEALRTVQATSVTSERNFSEANNLVSKVRNRLGDENINAILFLKCYFRNKN